jgi:hypothetical protein
MDAAVAKNRFGQLRKVPRTTQKTSGDSLTNVRMDGEKGTEMKEHRFTLILSGPTSLEPDLANALYEATRGDIELNMRDGIAFLEFHRKARNLQEAIISAIKDVDQANVGVRVVRVESEAANTIAKINADLLGISSD